MNSFYYALFTVLGTLVLIAVALVLIVLAIVFNLVEKIQQERSKDYHEGD